MKKILSILLAAVLIASLAACGSAPKGGETGGSGSGETAGEKEASGKTKILTIGTADTGGTMYPVGAAIAKVINDNVSGVKVNVETSKGSPVNATNLQTNEIDLGMVAGDVAYSAFNGVTTFDGNKQDKIRVLAGCYPSLSNWIALKNSGMEFVHDLKGKKVAVGPQASATEIAANAAFTVMGIDSGNTTIENLGLGDGADAVGDGITDSAHGFAGVPIAGQLNLSNTKDTIELKYTDEELDQIIANNGSYYKAVIPKGTYKGQEEDIPTFGVKALVCVSADMDEELVYEMAKALAEHIPDLVAGHASMSAMEDPAFFSSDMPIPLHPGAERYYKEAGYIK